MKEEQVLFRLLLLQTFPLHFQLLQRVYVEI